MLATVLAGMHPARLRDRRRHQHLRRLAWRPARSARCRSCSSRRWAGAREATVTVSSGSGGHDQPAAEGPRGRGVPLGGRRHAGDGVRLRDAVRGPDHHPDLHPGALAATGTYTINLDGGGAAELHPHGRHLQRNARSPRARPAPSSSSSSRNCPWAPRWGPCRRRTPPVGPPAWPSPGTSGGPLQFTPAPHNFGSLATGNSRPGRLHPAQQRRRRHHRSDGEPGDELQRGSVHRLDRLHAHAGRGRRSAPSRSASWPEPPA